ncbi:MAG: hypothetical protein ACYC7J_10955 [Syntrophales bacterium]
MRRTVLFVELIGLWILFLPAGCSDPQPITGTGAIARVQTECQIANRELLIQVAKQFYTTHPDRYDMLVLWSAPELTPGHSFYFPVKNDVPGIGYRHGGAEFFDDSADFGSRNLQGIVWMGPNWSAHSADGSDPRSVLGILAQETGHRWGATLHHRDPDLASASSALLADSYHWNTYLHTGASPLGGNDWKPLGDSLYQAIPVDYVKFCQLDLYAMGLLPAERVRPVQLLVNTRLPGDGAGPGVSKSMDRVSAPFTVRAEVKEILIEQIIAAEGRREPDVGFNASTIRQAWIYVYRERNFLSETDLDRLNKLRNRWDDFFSQATDGLSTMRTSAP